MRLSPGQCKSQDPSSGDRLRQFCGRLSHLPSIVGLSILVAVQWLWIPIGRGLHAETEWMVLVREPGIQGWLYSDPSRPLLQIPFALARLIAPESMLAVSWVIFGYVLVSALLTYCLALSLFCGMRWVAFVAASVAISFAADQAGSLFSMVILWQCTIGVLLSALAFANLGKSGFRIRWLLALIFGSALALWTYEASVIPLIVTPLIVVVGPNCNRRGLLAGLTGLGLTTVPFTLATLARITSGTDYYQRSKFTGIPDPLEIGRRFATWGERALNPGRWPDPWTEGWFADCVSQVNDFIGYRSIAVATTWAAILALILVFDYRNRRWLSAPIRLSRVYAFVLVMLVASYTPYLFVIDGGGHWRTHMLSQPYWGILTSTILISLLRFSRTFLALALMSVVLLVGWGTYVGLLGQTENASRWENSRAAMQAITEQVGFASSEDLIVVLGVDAPLESLCRSTQIVDPFGDTYWLESGLRLYFPGPSGAPRGYYLKPGEPLPTDAITSDGMLVGGVLTPWKRVYVVHLSGSQELVGDPVYGEIKVQQDVWGRPDGRASTSTPLGQETDRDKIRENLNLKPTLLP